MSAAMRAASRRRAPSAEARSKRVAPSTSAIKLASSGPTSLYRRGEVCQICQAESTRSRSWPGSAATSEGASRPEDARALWMAPDIG